MKACGVPNQDSTFIVNPESFTFDMSSIFILIRSLDVGGAERQVCVLAEALVAQGHQVSVGLFYGGGALEGALKDKGVTIIHLKKKRRWDLIGWFWRYLQALKVLKPDVVYSFLTTSNIIATLGHIFNKVPVVWSIRSSFMDLTKFDWLARLCAWIERKLSSYPKAIIFNSNCGQQYYKKLGYCPLNAVVIPNGIDTDRFNPDAHSGRTARAQLNIPEDAIVIGMLARYDPMKDYNTFIEAARTLSQTHKNLYFIAAGPDTNTAPWSKLPPHFLTLGAYQDVTGLLNALNIMVLCSHGEGFPNVIGEAMACGVPVVATDVGDSALIVGKLGITIPPEDSTALVQAITTLMSKSASATDIRQRILTTYSVNQMCEQTLDILRIS